MLRKSVLSAPFSRENTVCIPGVRSGIHTYLWPPGGSNDANNQRFRLLLNLIGQNLQDLQYIVFHWNKCNTAPEVKRWPTDSPTTMCVDISLMAPGAAYGESLAGSGSPTWTTVYSINSQTTSHSVKDEASQLQDTEATVTPQIQQLGFWFVLQLQLL